MICIVTVYKSTNFGSYLQAKVLSEVLLKYDDEVIFLDGKFRPWIYKFQLKGIIRDIFHCQFSKSWYMIQKIYHNYKLWRKLPSKSLKSIKKNKDVTYVIGSDEIWNFDREICRKPSFWGEGLDGIKIAYAPSINNASEKTIRSISGFINQLSTFAAISVRDSHSQRVIRKFVNTKVPILLDPTLLKSVDYYKQNSYKKLPYNYIAIYAFSLHENDIANIQRFAKENHLKTVCLSGINNWCDTCLRIDTENPFLYYLDAKYVVTNTFHGTIFAINFHKNFISLAYNNIKVAEILKEFNLTDRIVTGFTYNVFSRIVQKDCNFHLTDDILRKKRLESIEFLEKNLRYN